MEHVLTLHHENFNTLSQREEYWTVHICTNCKALSHMWSLFIPTILWSMGFPDCSGDKGSTCNAGHSVSIPGLGRSPGRGGGNQFQYSCLENSMARGAWWATVHGVTKSQTQLTHSLYIPSPTFSHDLQKHIPSFLLNTLSSEESKAFQTEAIYAPIDFSHPLPLKSFL